MKDRTGEVWSFGPDKIFVVVGPPEHAHGYMLSRAWRHPCFAVTDGGWKLSEVEHRSNPWETQTPWCQRW